MKNIFNVALVATLAIAASVAAQEAPAAGGGADTAAVVAQEVFQVPQNQTTTPTSASQDQNVDENEGDNDDQSAQCDKKHHRHEHHHKHHHKHHKYHHHKHGKQSKKDRCSIKYVTVASVSECKRGPTKCPPKLEATDATGGAAAGGDAAPIAHEAAAIMEPWNPPPPTPHSCLVNISGPCERQFQNQQKDRTHCLTLSRILNSILAMCS